VEDAHHHHHRRRRRHHQVPQLVLIWLTHQLESVIALRELTSATTVSIIL